MTLGLGEELAVVEGEERRGLLAFEAGDHDVRFRAAERERKVRGLEAPRAAALVHDAAERHSASTQRTSSGGGTRAGETTKVLRASR